ncbi:MULTISPECIES: sulfatase-like hydrolase/transferase [Salinibaculum]|uniref:sulfatase-like hydrolase/transferase n=1 Tax=Salinibaculum TaxID=2732368 RepID=UPI0030D590F8
MGNRIRNVLLYVDDAVRYETIVDELASLGPTYKTVAASTHTPTSFGSILTGLYPPENGILSFKHTAPSTVQSVFGGRRHNVTIAEEGGMNHSIADIFRNPPRESVEAVEPPFFHIVRRPGGHAPYNGFEWDTYEYCDQTAVEYLREISDEPKKAREDYARGVERSFAEFKRVLEVLDDRNLRHETLVIYTSDHGELLGEYGFFGHTHLATPEIVYVPTTFIHPDLDEGHMDSLLHHIDLLPTASEILDQPLDCGRMRGKPFGKGRERGYNHFEHVRYGDLPNIVEPAIDHIGTFERTVQSMWDKHGGQVFVEGGYFPTLLVYLVLLVQSPIGNQLLHNGGLRDLFRRFAPGHQTYGKPNFDRNDARASIDTLFTSRSEQSNRELDDETVERLQDMGYL